MTSPDDAMINLYGYCEGEFRCSIGMTQINTLPGCGGIDASNYQVVYYTCRDSTTISTTGLLKPECPVLV